MPTEPASPRPDPTETITASGTAGAAAIALRVVAGMTNEKILTLLVAGLLVWVSSQMITTQSADRVNSQRMYDDARERDRQHCDSREDKIARDAAAEMKNMREWYAAQSDVQRRFEAEQREKDRQQVAELAKQIATIRMKVSGQP
jgi:hypothetical protein